MEEIVCIQLPYYKGSKDLKVEKKKLVGVLKSSISNYQPSKSPEQIISDAIDNPIGSKSLADVVKGKKRVLIVTSDHTRPVPSKITLPILTKCILESEPSAEITILIATGLHRPTTREEQIEKFSLEMLNRFNFVVHNAFDKEKMIYVKKLPSGADFEVNCLAVESDVVITEGFIEPHFFAGFSGGRKSILPGISSATTIKENHCSKLISHPLSKGGVLSGNIINEDMIVAARAVNVAFTLNVALNGKKEIIGAFAGDIEKAHEVGCDFVKKLSIVEPIKGDIVITSNGGYPLDQNLYQCSKAISTAVECANDGAILIIVASCVDGIGGNHFQKLMTMGTPEEINKYLLSIPPKKTIEEQWCAQIFSKIMLKHKIIVVSENLDPNIAKKANMILAKSMEEALQISYKIVGDDASVVVIPDGISVIAVSNDK